MQEAAAFSLFYAFIFLPSRLPLQEEERKSVQARVIDCQGRCKRVRSEERGGALSGVQGKPKGQARRGGGECEFLGGGEGEGFPLGNGVRSILCVRGTRRMVESG